MTADNEVPQHHKGMFFSSAHELTVDDTSFLLRQRSPSRLSHYGGSTSSDEMDSHHQLSPTTPVPVIRITPVPSPQMARRMDSGSLSPFKVLPRISTSSRSTSEESLPKQQDCASDNLYLHADYDEYHMRTASPPPGPPPPSMTSPRRRLIRTTCVDYTDHQMQAATSQFDQVEAPVRPKTPHKDIMDNSAQFPSTYGSCDEEEFDVERPMSPCPDDKTHRQSNEMQHTRSRPKTPPADNSNKSNRQRARPKTPCPDVKVADADDMIELDIEQATDREASDGAVTGNDILAYSAKPSMPSPMRRFPRPSTPSPTPPSVGSAKATSLLARRRHRTVAGHLPTYLHEEDRYHAPKLAANARSVSSYELYGFETETVELHQRPMSTLSSPAIALFPPDSQYGQFVRKKLSKSESNISTSSNDSGYST